MEAILAGGPGGGGRRTTTNKLTRTMVGSRFCKTEDEEGDDEHELGNDMSKLYPTSKVRVAPDKN